MTDTQRPIGEALDDIGNNGDGFDLVIAKDGDGPATATLQGHKDVGKPGGWSFGGAIEFAQRQKTRILGKITWRPRDR